MLGAVSLAQDITQVKLIEVQLKKYHDQLDKAVKKRTKNLAKTNKELQMEIARHTKADDSLRENQRLMQAILDNTTAVIYIKDKYGKYMLVNRQFKTLFHTEKDEVIGRTVEDIFPKKIAEKLRENDEKIFKGDAPIVQEEIVDQDDGPHTYISTKFLLFDSNGVPDRICGISTDITIRKKMENALKKSEAKYRKLIETAHDAIICDIGGTITVWNKSAEKLFGYSKDEIIGKQIEILIPEKYKKAHQKGLENFIKTGVGNIVDKKRIEVSGITKEGVVIPIEISLTAQKIEKEHYCFMSVIRDLTEKKNAEKALKASAHKYRTLVQTIPEIIYKIDTDGCFLYINNSIRKLGYEPEDLMGIHFSEIILPEDVDICSRSVVLSSYANIVNGEKEMLKLFDERRTGVRLTKDLVMRFVPKSWNRVESEIPVMVGSVTSSGDYDDESKEFSGTIGIIMDITEKTKLLSESIRSSQLAAVGEMAAGVAHEINNPINTILNSAQLLLDESSDKEINYNDVNVIIEESVNIANIVRSLLSFVRDKNDERTNSNVLNLVTEILVLAVKQMKDNGIKVKVSMPQNLPDIFVCRQRIQQVFLNILNNARYALDEKYPDPHKDKVIEISGKMTTINGTRHIQIMFHDRGIGISANKINKVMSPFITTKPLNKGTGLGLSISNTIINEHNGKMVIESVQGQSTKVIISLPVKT